jgi:hypothetical protein
MNNRIGLAEGVHDGLERQYMCGATLGTTRLGFS